MPPSAKEAKPKDVNQRGKAVPPRDLLAFLICAPVVTDGNFVDPTTKLGDLDGHLGLEAKTVGLERELAQHVTAEDLVSNLHVRHVQPSEKIRQQCEPAIRRIVPEIQDPVRPAVKAIAEYHIRLILKDRLEQ